MPITTATLASNASMSRNSVFSKPGTVIHFQVLPPFALLPTMPPLPLTQMILSFTTLNPRRLDFVPELSISTEGYWAKDDNAEIARQRKNNGRNANFIDKEFYQVVFNNAKIIKNLNRLMELLFKLTGSQYAFSAPCFLSVFVDNECGN